MYRSSLLFIFAIACAIRLGLPCFGQLESPQSRGQLVMIGGGLGVSNQAVFHDLIESAGGIENARFVLLPAANLSLESAHHFQKELAAFGVSDDHVEVLDVLHSNALLAVKDPANIEKMDRATAVYMTGGDQVRLVGALTNADGTDTPLLAAMRRLYRRGGVIAGTSAGASAQSVTMLAASGLPSMMVDEGLDALDFGLTTDSVARGILVTRGLGFFEHGVIDQHFLQYRGRLGRLSRVTLERSIPFGIGIDRDSAIRVDKNGKIVVTGGRAIVVIPSQAESTSGPMGYKLTNMSISLLSTGDVFDPLDLSFNIHSSKQPIVNENLTFDGNFLITDIGSGYAVSNALISGLAENTQSVQEGVVLKFHDHTSHGYRYEFRKTTKTKSFHADSLDGSLYSVLDVQLGISPIANGLFPSETQKPIDVQDLPMATKDAISSIAFRGILTTNPRLEFRPTDFVTRREFALACVRCVHLNAPSDEPISSIESIDVASIELRKAIEAGFIELDSLGQLRPDRPVSDRDLKRGLTRLVKRCVEVPSPAFQSALARIQEADHATISRGHFALMLSQLLFPASHPSEKGD